MAFISINDLIKAASLTGNEKIPVSKSEYMDVNQIIDFAKSADLDDAYIKIDGTNSILSQLKFNTEDELVSALLSGELRWTIDSGTLSVGLPDGGSLQIGQEVFNYYTNVDTVELTEGMYVCVKSIPGNRKAIKRLDPSVKADVLSMVGMVTVPSIPVNGVGRVTKLGHVTPIDTRAWADNAPLYVSHTAIGTLTDTAPPAGIYCVKVGHVVVSTLHGTIDIMPSFIPKMSDLSDVNGTPLTTAGQFYVLQSDGTFSANKNINDYYTKTESDILIGAKQTAALSNDIQGDATSTTKYPSVKSIKDYADSLVVGLLDYRGGFDASVNQYPTTGGSGAGGEILKGDMWVVSIAGVIDGKTIHAGDSLIANIDNPAQDSSKWNTVNSNLSYIPEDVANKSESITSDTGSDIKYPTVKAVETYSEKISNKSTNVTADAASDEKYPSVKAIKTYADGKVSKTGSETIYDTKTFDVSPNVPSIPASDTSAVNKEFVVGTATSAITKAQQWAENPEDVAVETGKYSALHWAAKAAEIAEEVAIVAPILDQRIDTLENVINSMNPNQETRTTASGIDVISLPKTAANTGMQLQLFGQSAQNLVVNGDFRNGTTGWPVGNSTNSVTNSILTNTGNGTSNGPNTYSNIGAKIVGNKYYLRANVTAKSALCSQIRLASTDDVQRIDSPIVNNSYLLSGVITASSTYSFIAIYHYYASAADANGAAIEVDNVMAINLTATFGAGNEPTKDQCDLLFANYFKGSKNVLGTGRVRSVGSNLFNQYDVTEGYRLTAADGNVSVSPTALISGYIPVSPSTTYLINSGIGSDAGGHCFYDTNRNFISGVISPTTGAMTFTTPVSAKYVRLSLLIANKSAAKLERGTSATAYEPFRQSALYLTTSELRSNGTTKDEIRKGTNGYELVKRVGVGTLGSELIPQPVNFTTGWTRDNSSLVTIDSSTQFTTTGTAGLIRANAIPGGNKFVRVRIKGSISSGTLRVRGTNSNANAVLLTGTFDTFFYVNWDTQTGFYLLALNAATVIITELSVKEVVPVEAILNPSTLTEIGGLPYYTLATPVITPIPHAGLLNSNSNGTVYFEPVVADAGVYSTKIDIQLTDYPISSFESIRKYANGTYTELDISTAVIASGGLSFTHPNLTAGDLVLFTYNYNRESIGRSMTLTHYDNRYVVADTSNGKVYRWSVVSTNGVPSLTLTEV